MTGTIGWRVHWTHAESGDRMCGAWWPDRETADELAEVCRRSGWCKDVLVKRARLHEGETA